MRLTISYNAISTHRMKSQIHMHTIYNIHINQYTKYIAVPLTTQHRQHDSARTQDWRQQGWRVTVHRLDQANTVHQWETTVWHTAKTITLTKHNIQGSNFTFVTNDQPQHSHYRALSIFNLQINDHCNSFALLVALSLMYWSGLWSQKITMRDPNNCRRRFRLTNASGCSIPDWCVLQS